MFPKEVFGVNLHSLNEKFATKKQKQQRLKIQRRRALLGFVLAVVLVSVLLFMTPIFNIRSVSVEGNVLVTAEQFKKS